MAGGYSHPGGEVNTIQYVEIATTGNTVDFGDLTSTLESAQGLSSSTRGVVCGGYDAPAKITTVQYFLG